LFVKANLLKTVVKANVVQKAARELAVICVAVEAWNGTGLLLRGSKLADQI
jgi:hypothetical protein